MRKKKLVIAGIAAGVLLIAGAFAFFSLTADTKQNKFIIATGGNDDDEIKIIEEKWDDDSRDENDNNIPDDAEDMEPGKEIVKDPHVKSEVAYDGFVIMRVSVPVLNAELVNVDERDTASSHDAYIIQKLNTKDFVKLGQVVSKSEDTKSVYYYGYKKVLPAYGETTNLFEQVRMQDFAFIGKDLEQSIDVDAIIVQKINPNTGKLFGTDADGNWHEENGAAEAFKLVKSI